jgi:hypothetical protein
MTDGPLGIPLEFLVLAILVVVVGTFLSKNRPTRRAAQARETEEEKPDITSLIGKPESHMDKKQVRSLEDILVGDIDNAPSIGADEKTEIQSSLDLLTEEKQEPAEEKPAKKTQIRTLTEPDREVFAEDEEPPKEAREDILTDLDELKEDLEEPEDFMKPPSVTPAKTPTMPPPAKPELEDVRKELEKGLLKSVLGKEPPEKIGDKGIKYFCMENYDLGVSPIKVISLLRKERVLPGKARDIAMQTFKLWLEKREPVIRDIKEASERIKRIHYKFLKRQIDEKTRKDMLIENQKMLVEFEARLRATDPFFME